MESNAPTQQRASVDPHDPLIGRVLDRRYRIDSRIARGGMAAVYVAHDLRLDRTVAIKVMHPGMAEDPVFVDRFVREARAAAQLTHPHVVAVHDQGDDGGTLFLAMEYVPGHTLRDVIRDRAPLSPAEALAQVEPILSALAAAHRAGLVHRDVKPENVLILPGEHGEPDVAKVADFGLAKAINTATQHTATGVVIGSVSYLAPELVVKGRADERVDVYAVGVVLFELLTGRRPHEGDSPIQIAYSHVHEDVPAPSSLAPGIPAYLDALVARACARDVDQRPADASVLLHHVRRVALALREGVTVDEDLEADLRPHAPAAPLLVEVEAERSGIHDVEETDATRGVPALANGAGAAIAVDTAEEELTGALTAQADRAPEHTQQIQLASATPFTDLMAADEGTYSAPATTSSPRRRRGPLLLLLAVLLAVAVGTGAWWMGTGRYQNTPSVIEMSKAEAISTLEEAGFSVTEGEPGYSEDIARGQVLDTSPGPGDKVVGGGSVEIILSLGPERYEVPDLSGVELTQASNTLGELKLEIGRETEKFNESVPKGNVISTDPAPGTVVRPGTAVKVVVSKGRKPIELSDATGKASTPAVKKMRKNGLTVTVEEKFSDDVAEGVVISQKPASGTLYKGDTVTVVVSRGPELVTVPDVRRQGLADATKELEALGFKVATKKSSLYLGLQYVAGSDPGSGAKARKGSTITLSLV